MRLHSGHPVSSIMLAGLTPALRWAAPEMTHQNQCVWDCLAALLQKGKAWGKSAERPVLCSLCNTLESVRHSATCGASRDSHVALSNGPAHAPLHGNVTLCVCSVSTRSCGKALQCFLTTSGHLATTAAGAGFATGAGSATSPAPSARRAAGVACCPVLAALLDSATVEGVDALSPISFHISSAACVRLHTVLT